MLLSNKSMLFFSSISLLIGYLLGTAIINEKIAKKIYIEKYYPDTNGVLQNYPMEMDFSPHELEDDFEYNDFLLTSDNIMIDV